MIAEYRKQMKVAAREIDSWLKDGFKARGQFQLYLSAFLSIAVLALAIKINWWYGGVMLTLDAIIVATIAYYVGQIHKGIEV